MQFPSPDRIELTAGTILNSRFKVIKPLGAGAQAAVYLSEDILLSRSAALKVYACENDEKNRERFKKEAQLMAALDHPNIVRVFGSGITESGYYYIAMEHIEGDSLAELIKMKGPLEPSFLIDIFSQVLSALSYLHENSILHRDLKPENILLMQADDEGQIQAKLVDFGIAKILDSSNNASSTQTRFAGTAAYMSPEQCQGKALDARSDLYSLGCVIFEAVQGVPPFQGSSEYDTMYRQTSEPAPLLNTAEGVCELVARALQKDPNKRFASASEMLKAMPSKDSAQAWRPRLRKSETRSSKKKILLFSSIACSALALIIYFVQNDNLTKSKAKPILEEKFGKISNARFLAEILGKTTDHEKRSEYANRILQNSDPVKDIKERIFAYQHLATNSHAKGQYLQALAYSDKALKEMQDPRITSPFWKEKLGFYNQRTGLLAQAGKKEEARECNLVTIKLASEAPKDTVGRNYTLMNAETKLGMFDKENKDLKHAELHLRRALDRAKEFPQDIDVQDGSITTASALAQTLLAQRKMAEAEPYIQFVIDKTASLPPDHYQFQARPEFILNIGATLSAYGQNERGLELLEKADSIYEKYYRPEQRTSRAQGLQNQYIVLRKLKRYAQAKQKLMQAVEIVSPMESAHPVDTLTNIGATLSQLGDPESARKAWEIADNKLEKYNDTLSGAVSLPPAYHLGLYYLAKKEYARSKDYLEKALAFTSKNYPNSPQIAVEQNWLKNVERRLRSQSSK